MAAFNNADVFTEDELEQMAEFEARSARSTDVCTTRPIEVVEAPRQRRALDAAALDSAARRAGYLSGRQAIIAALGRNDSLVDVLEGRRAPGPTGRALVARLLDVHEDTIWPFVEAAA